MAPDRTSRHAVPTEDRSLAERASAGPLWLLLLLCCALAASPVQGQQVLGLVPSGAAAEAAGVDARLVYRQNGFAEKWKDPTVHAVYVAEDMKLEPDFWRGAFAEEGGVAHVGPKYPSQNFTVTSGDNNTEDTRPDIDFSGMASAMMVDTGGYLLFNNVMFSDLGNASAYTYSDSQPYINRGVGYGLWPTIALAPQALIKLINVSASYFNPSPLDTCEQYNRKAVFGLQQAFNESNVISVNKTGGMLIGPLNITVLVIDAKSNTTVGNATAVYQNVTFNCLPPRQAAAASSSGLSPGALAAAIAVPIAVVLAALLLACCCIRRRNLRRMEAAQMQSLQDSKDLEAGSLQALPPDDAAVGRIRDQNDRGMQQGGFAPGTRASSGDNGSSSSTIRSFLAIPPDSTLMDGILGSRRNPHSTGGSGGSGRRNLPGGSGSSGASILTPVGSMPLAVVPSSSHGTSGAGAHASSAGTDSSSMGVLHTGASGSSGENAGSGLGSGGGKQSVAEKYASIASLLKTRSDIAVLRELKIGPLLGRGSYGRVYRGRWKATTVAVKIIEHAEGSPGTASSGGKKISVGRESLLATSISHPNVVQTYHISTMTVAQRSALANTWLSEGDGSGSDGGKQGLPQDTDQQQDADSSSDDNSRTSIEAQQKNLLETWLIMEFCEKGSLERAVNQGRFIRRSDKEPEMVGIYKALLDTASGLDYLHSIGVVHGDLKTANVLLKGSAKDVRGFMCKITDFGLSRVLDLDATHISTATYGTIVYMPKELLLSGRMTQSTDIYSFGLMMWELYTSSRVFDEGLSIGQMFYMIAYQNWRPLIPDDCPPGFVELMTACWHEDPEQRPTAQQLLKRLQKLYVQAKQELSARKQEEQAAADAGAAAAAKVLSGSSARASLESNGAGSAGSTGRAAAAGSGGQGAVSPSTQKLRPKPAAPPGMPASPFAGSGSSMADSVVGPIGSGGLVPGSGGLHLSGLTVSGGDSDGPKEGLGSGDAGEANYRPYAAAVLNRGRSGPLATGSVLSGNYSSAQRSSAGGRQPAQTAAAAAPPAGSNFGFPGPRLGAAVGGAPPGIAPNRSEIEAYDDPIASESLLQNISTYSNVQDDGDTCDDEEDCAGFFGEQGMRAAIPGSSVEMTNRPQGRMQDPRWARAPAGGVVGAAGAPQGSRPALGDLGRDDSFRDSFSTGTMPSVAADSWLWSQSSRSCGGSTQPSGRISSSMNLGSGAMPPTSPTHGSGTSYRESFEGAHGAPAEPGAAAAAGGAASGVVQGAGGSKPPASPSNRNYGMLQTVHEGSGPLEGAGAVSLQLSPDATGVDAVGQAVAAMAQAVKQPALAAELQPPPAAAGAPASPFAALAQRAGSMFAPFKP